MPPESIDPDPSSLPRSFRGYDRRATEERLREAAWEYGLLIGEHRKLKKTCEDLEARLAAVTASAARPPDTSEAAIALFRAAHRAVRELRESTRRECELAIKKAKGHAARIERDAERAHTGSLAVAQAAGALRANLQRALARIDGAPEPAPLAELPRSPLESKTQ